MRLENEPMANHTTFRIGGPAEVLIIPQNESELIECVKRCQKDGTPYHILGNGSNILVRDEGVKGCVIKNSVACHSLIQAGDCVEVGSSVRLQRFIKFCIENNLEAMEYLYSVPATIGGAICMNAGRGRAFNKQVSDKLLSVRVFDGNNVIELQKNECKFDYRKSIFQMNRSWLILSAKFKLCHQDSIIGSQKIMERMELVKKYQDQSYPSAGSIFKRGNPYIYKLIKGYKIGDAKFSEKASNWIINCDRAKSGDVQSLIQLAKFLHKIFLQPCELELEIW